MRYPFTSERPVRVAACLGALLLTAAGCGVPLTTESLSGLALGGGALAAIGEVNQAGVSSTSHYRYAYDAEIEEVVWLVQYVIRSANRAAYSAESVGAQRTSSSAPRKQLTPVPVFEIDRTLSKATSDSIVYVISFRRGRRAAFIATPSNARSVRIDIAPYEPESGALMMLAADDAQRNAVEALHEHFFKAAREMRGPESLVRQDWNATTSRRETPGEGSS
ncbi:MAG: hypothetical protein ABFS14_08440 [Gemmatimonadota bacterium]